MFFVNSQAGAVNLRAKLSLFILILVLAFGILDVGPLRALYSQLRYTHIDEAQLNQIRRLLFNLFMLKVLWLAILSGIAVGFGYWIIKPYKDKKVK